jgi:hypothetical protein
MSNCLNCTHARQVGDKTTQEFVGCVLLNNQDSYETIITQDDSIQVQSDYILQSQVKNSNIYQGYIYFGRRVGDIVEDEILGRGALTLGLIVESKGICHKFENLEDD